MIAGRCSFARLRAATSAGQESWDAIYLAGSKIGYVHTYVEKVKDRGSDKEYLRVRVDIEQRLKRGRDVAVTKLSYGTIETLDGQVLRLDTLTLAGTQSIRAHGDVIKGAMTLKLDTGGQDAEAGDPLESRRTRPVRRGTEHGSQADETE